MTKRRLGEPPPERPRPLGVRAVLDVRPLQEPDRSPTTAIYLEQLLRAYVADPLPGESFTVLTQAGLADPTLALDGLEPLPVAGRRALPPSRLLRSGALTTDPFLLRSASIAAGWRAGASGAAGTVYHTASGAVPIASWLPVVVTLLDLAPWELPEAYQRSPAARFGQRLRARILRDARAVIVPSTAAAQAARRLLHVRQGRIRVIPLAPRDAFTPSAAGAADEERSRLGLPERYLVFPGRFDARQDLPTLFEALRLVASEPAGTVADGVPWPPRVVLVDASPEDRAEVARAAARFGVGELIAYARILQPEALASLVAGARAAIVPALSATSALPAIEALAAGTPVVASAVGSLPEAVGAAGLLVEPRDARRLAVALRTVWSDETVTGRLRAAIRSRAAGSRWSWRDVAEATRAVYAEAATGSSPTGGPDSG